MKKDTTQENIGMKGVWTITKAKIETLEQKILHKNIVHLQKTKSPYMHLVRKLNEICETEKIVVENLIPTVGRTMLADNLTNAAPDNTPRVNYVALGTNGTAPANSDTTLGTETYRNAVASETNANNIAYVSGFFSATEVTGTFLEAGLFSDGTGTVDTGVLLSHVALNVTKSITESLTLDWQITFS